MPMTRPAIDGPTTDAAWKTIVFRLSALGRCSRGTRLGISDWRAGASNADAADVSAAST